MSLYIIKDLSSKNKEYMENEYLIIEVNEENSGFYSDLREKYQGTLQENQIEGLKVMWVAYLANCMFVDKIYEYDDFYKKYIDLLCYSIYAIGWGYILGMWFFALPGPCDNII